MACLKVYYKDRKTAKAQLKLINKHRRLALTDVYLCSECGGYHLTSQQKWRTRSRTNPTKLNR